MRRLAALGLLLAVQTGAAEAAASQAEASRARFELANRCFALVSPPSGRSVAIAGDGYRLAGRRARGAPFFFKPTGLGTYLIHDRGGRLLSVGEAAAVVRADAPADAGEWAPRRGRRAFSLRSTASGQFLAVDRATGGLVTGPAVGNARFRLMPRRRCRRYPEAKLGARGLPAKGRRRDGTVFGYADAHLHVVADLRAGGQVISGESFNRFGVTEALGRDAEVHGRDGSLDFTGNLLRSGNPAGTHDTDGWPSFAGWPVFDTFTHQQVYYRWLQRAYRAGLRMVTAQLVEDEALCELQPRKSHSCDETETVELEAQRLRELQDYVDAQQGGPGRGWFRIVDHPRRARRVIERGKLAVLIGVESSSPFGCSEFLGQPQCDRADVDRGIALYRQLGISSMFIAHWIDNAFFTTFQLATTGRPFATGPCPQPEQGEQCNAKGLTELGEYLVNRLMDNHMLIEVDHLSEVARERVLQIAERRNYPLVSSHTNSGGLWTDSDLRRLYAVGGFATARPDTAAKLAASILEFRRFGKAHLFGVGLGTDTGGFASAPGPDPEAQEEPLRYPFKSYDGRVKFVCQVTGGRKFDLNKDGVAQYGLYADLLAYMRGKPGGKKASRILFRSAEAYLRTWERAH